MEARRPRGAGLFYDPFTGSILASRPEEGPVSRLLAAMRNPYVLIGEGFLIGGLIVLAAQGGREAVAAPAPAPASASR